MKYFQSLFLLLFIFTAVLAQDEGEGFFKKENLFTGGGLTLNFSNNNTVLGVNPHFGYSLGRFVDVAASFNYIYASQRDNIVSGDKLRQSIFAPGMFVRLFPLKFLFAHAQYEHSFIRQRYIPMAGSGFVEEKSSQQANSFLFGGGYCGGRGTGGVYYYFSVLWDIGRDSTSPYLDRIPDLQGGYILRSFPIYRAGVTIPIFQGRKNRR
jgi:hypothetical protein